MEEHQAVEQVVVVDEGVVEIGVRGHHYPAERGINCGAGNKNRKYKINQAT